MSIAASESKPELSGEEDSAALLPSGTVAMPESDLEMTAMLSQAAVRVGLEWRPPLCPEPSRLDDWFFGVVRAGSQRPAPMPFFPEVHEGLTRSWMAPFSAGNRPANSSSLTTLDGGAARGCTRLVCPAISCGEAASALHATALLQVLQAKALGTCTRVVTTRKF